MFKTAQDRQDFIGRVASHATKPHANGRVDDIPSWAIEPEHYYNTLKQQFEIARKQLDSETDLVQTLKFRLRTTMPRAEFERISAEHRRAADHMRKLQETTGELRSLLRAVAVNAWGSVYFYCAQRILPTELRIKLDNEVADLLGRQTPTDGIGKANSELSYEAKHRKMRKDNKKKDLERLRDRITPTRVRTVWSDERGGRVR